MHEVSLTSSVWQKSWLEQGLKIYGLWVKSNLLPFLANNVLLKHSFNHLFTYCLWLVPVTMAELSSHNRPQGHRAYGVYYPALCRNS